MKIRIKSVAQSFLIKPVITVKLNGKERAWINCGDTDTIEAAEGENTLEFSASLRKKVVHFRAIKDVSITLKWNRVTGGMEALVSGEDVEVL